MDLLFTSEPRTDRLCCPRCVKSLKNACPLQISCEKNYFRKIFYGKILLTTVVLFAALVLSVKL